jgi:hypothetical protein
MNTHIPGRRHRRNRAAVDDPAQKRRHVGNIYAGSCRRDDAAVGNAALSIGIAEDCDGLERDAPPAGDSAAVGDAAGKSREVLEEDAALMRRDRPAVGDAAAGA